MPLGLVFWILMLLCLVYMIWRDWPTYPLVGGTVMWFVLLGILGWATFGPAVK